MTTSRDPQNPAPDLTVAVCTWNRAEILDGSLAAIAAMRIPAGVTWELVVVDNNSTDHTQAVLQKYLDKLPLRIVKETRQGTSYARNTAVAAVRSDWFVFLDDDCRPEPDLVEQYSEAIRLHPDVALFGGTMRPEFESPPPKWLAENIRQLDNVTAWMEKAGPNRPLGPAESVFTGNLSVRTAVARQLPFDTNLGYVGGNRMAGEDIDFYVRVVGAGHRTYWWGTAAVRHFIPNRALTLNAIARKFYGDGAVEVRLYPEEIRALPTLLGVPRWALKQYVLASLSRRFYAPFSPARWLAAFASQARMRGLIAESRIARRSYMSAPPHKQTN